MRLGIAALMTLCLLTACSGASFSKLAVPDVIEYSRDTQAKAAAEVPGCPVLAEFMKDYYVMRQQARRARGG